MLDSVFRKKWIWQIQYQYLTLSEDTENMVFAKSRPDSKRGRGLPE
jgi:hypothetical protein